MGVYRPWVSPVSVDEGKLGAKFVTGNLAEPDESTYQMGPLAQSWVAKWWLSLHGLFSYVGL